MLVALYEAGFQREAEEGVSTAEQLSGAAEGVECQTVALAHPLPLRCS